MGREQRQRLARRSRCLEQTRRRDRRSSGHLQVLPLVHGDRGARWQSAGPDGRACARGACAPCDGWRFDVIGRQREFRTGAGVPWPGWLPGRRAVRADECALGRQRLRANWRAGAPDHRRASNVECSSWPELLAERPAGSCALLSANGGCAGGRRRFFRAQQDGRRQPAETGSGRRKRNLPDSSRRRVRRSGSRR